MSLSKIEYLFGTYEKVTDTHVFFLKGPLSQWHKSPFIASSFVASALDSELIQYRFISCEQWMMFNKALFMQDFEIAKSILKETNQKKIKDLGRAVSNYNEELWDIVRGDVVTLGNYYKFTFSSDLLFYLLESGDKTLVEVNPSDSIWGIGLDINSPDILDEKTWKGKNLLGKSLTFIRNWVKSEEYKSKLFSIKPKNISTFNYPKTYLEEIKALNSFAVGDNWNIRENAFNVGYLLGSMVERDRLSKIHKFNVDRLNERISELSWANDKNQQGMF